MKGMIVINYHEFREAVLRREKARPDIPFEEHVVTVFTELYSKPGMKPLTAGEIRDLKAAILTPPSAAPIPTPCPNAGWDAIEAGFRALNEPNSPNVEIMVHNMKILYYKGWLAAFDLNKAMAQEHVSESEAMEMLEHCGQDLEAFFAPAHMDEMMKRAQELQKAVEEVPASPPVLKSFLH